MLKSKKSQIFTLIAIALLFLFFVSYEVYSLIQDRHAIRTRVTTMDSFLFSLEQDLDRQLYVSGFRIIFLAEDKITRTGSYITDFNNFFNEAIIKGTIDNNYNPSLEGVNISSIKSLIQTNADKMNLNVDFSSFSVYAGQEDPWNVIVYFNTTINLTDKSDLASWNKQIRIKSKINIENFEDPLFLIHTGGKVSRKINKTIYEGNYVSNGNIENLSLHLSNKNYASDNDAPSFFDRIQGKVSSNINGIESFVHIPDLSAQGIEIESKAVVDYIYFSSSNPGIYRISGMPFWFLIDENHLDKYQVRSLSNPA